VCCCLLLYDVRSRSVTRCLAFEWVKAHTSRNASFASWVDHGHAVAAATGASSSSLPASVGFTHSGRFCSQAVRLLSMLLVAIGAPPQSEWVEFS